MNLNDKFIEKIQADLKTDTIFAAVMCKLNVIKKSVEKMKKTTANHE